MTARVCTILAPVLMIIPTRAAALERICDTAYENCRTPLLELIDAERVGIDVAFWFMEDARYSAALIRRFQAGVPVRILFDSEAVGRTGTRRQILDELAAAGIPLRDKTSGGIVHWKLMLFAGLETVQFSAANYSDFAFRPIEPYANYVDEVVYFTDKPSLVESFKTRFDDVWTTGSGYTNYANVSTPCPGSNHHRTGTVPRSVPPVACMERRSALHGWCAGPVPRTHRSHARETDAFRRSTPARVRIV